MGPDRDPGTPNPSPLLVRLADPAYEDRSGEATRADISPVHNPWEAFTASPERSGPRPAAAVAAPRRPRAVPSPGSEAKRASRARNRTGCAPASVPPGLPRSPVSRETHGEWRRRLGPGAPWTTPAMPRGARRGQPARPGRRRRGDASRTTRHPGPILGSLSGLPRIGPRHEERRLEIVHGEIGRRPRRLSGPK